MITGRGHGEKERPWQAWLLASVTTLILVLLILWPQGLGRQNAPSSLARLGQLLPNLSISLIGALALYSALIVFFGVLRWRTLLRAQGIELPVAFLARSWLAGAFLSAPFIGSLVRDLWRWYDSAKLDNAPRMGAVLAVEKCVGLAASVLLLFVGAALLLPLGVPLAKLRTVIVLGAAFAALAIAVAIVFYPRLLHVANCFVPGDRFRRFVGEFAAGVTHYRRTPGALAMAFLWSVFLRLTSFALLATSMAVLRPDALPWSEQAPGWLYLNSGTLIGQLWREPLSLQAGVELWLAPLGPLTGREALHSMIWWSQYLLPVLLGSLALMFGTRRRVAKVSVPRQESILLTEDAMRETRRQVDVGILAGGVGGLLAGGVAGFAEAAWIHWYMLQQPLDLQLYWWAPLVYGLACLFGGLAPGALIVIGGLLINRRFSFALASAGVFAALFFGIALVVGRYRFARDVLGDQPLQLVQMIGVLGGAFAAAALAGGGLYILLRLGPQRGRLFVPPALWCVILLIGIGVSMINGDHANGDARISRPAAVTASADRGDSVDGATNVILIVADTLRADYLRLYNADAAARTPALDAFAEDAILFRQSYAQAPWTKPSFATIFTGVYPSAHGALGKSSLLPQEFHTLAEYLQQAGFYTAGFPNNRNIAAWAGFAQGYDLYHPLDADRYFSASATSEMLAGYLILRQVWLNLTYPNINVAHFYQPADRVNVEVGAWLESAQEGPMHLFVHYMDPHDPYRSADVPGEAYAYTVMGYHLEARQWVDLLESSYIKEIEYFDAYFGELISDLRARGLYENSIIVFTSDHGEELYDHHGWAHGDTLYEEQLHVPLFIKLPQQKAAGAVNDYIARHVDLLPSVLHLLGLAAPEGLPGAPLLAADGTALNAETAHSFAEVDFLGTVARSLRDARHKIIETETTKRPYVKPLEFYDLQQDPQEQIDRAGAPEAAEAIEDLDRVGDTEALAVP